MMQNAYFGVLHFSVCNRIVLYCGKNIEIGRNTLKREKINFKHILYLITDKRYTDNLSVAVEEALRGGVNMVQYREKNPIGEEEKRQMHRIKELCKEYKALFLINDSPELAAEIGADGVHLGKNDMSVSAARKLLGEEMIIGRSARDIKEAVQAEYEGADYLGSGALYPTSTKKDTKRLSEKELAAICSAVSIPVVAIGGIEKERVELLKGSKIRGVASSKGILMQENIEENTKEFMDKIKKFLS